MAAKKMKGVKIRHDLTAKDAKKREEREEGE